MMVRLTGRLWDDDYDLMGKVIEIKVTDPEARWGVFIDNRYPDETTYVILHEDYQHDFLDFEDWGGVLP